MAGDRSDVAGTGGSFIRVARRDQIVAHAIAVIAALGVERASVVKIAERAGVSRGVINYHFRDLDDLHGAVVAEVYRLGGEELAQVVADAPTPQDALATFVGGSVDFYVRHPEHMTALREIFALEHRSRRDSGEHGREIDAVARLLADGQAAGQFRDFDVPTMVAFVRGVLDGAGARLVAAPDTVDTVRREAVTAVHALTTRKDT